jgi:uncharacterized protein (DUF2141 family)/signal peptidase I
MFARQNMLFVKNTGIKDFLLISLFFLSGSCLMGNTYYVAPDGLDSNPGTKDKPWATWGKAFNATEIQPGDTVYFRGGIYYKDVTEGENGWYYPSRSQGGSGYNITRQGTEGNWVYYWGYPDDVALGNYPILDCSTGYDITINTTTSNYGIRNGGTANYCHFKSLIIQNVKQYDIDGTIYPQGFVTAVYVSGEPMIWENCTVRNIHGHGFTIQGATAPNFNYLINCDGYDCCDSLTPYNPVTYDGPGNDGMGFYNVRAGNLKLINCRAWNNGDQGYSTGNNDVGTEDKYVEYEGCWAFRNGMMTGAGEGFKMGWIAYTDGNIKMRFKNCVSAFNKANGFFTYDALGDNAVWAEILNCTGYHNGYQGTAGGYTGYMFRINKTPDTDENELKRIIKNSISYKNEYGDVFIHDGALYTHDHNSWDIPITLTDADFVSLDSTGISGPRKPDGSLPDLNGFLKLKAGSKAVDAGVDVGLPYFGKAPDLGAYEYDPEEGMNQYPIISITSPEPGDLFTTPVNINIITDASDPDGSVSKVEFYNGSVKIGEKTSAPWSFTWSNVPEGTYNISAVATDDLNAKTPSAPVKITVNQPPPVINQPPSISITNPVTGSVFTAPVTISISADATDADGLVSKVEFFNGTGKLGERTSKPWTYTWNNIPAGTYKLTAVATDNASAKTTSAAVTITVNAYPEVSISSPVSGSNFNAPGNINIVAEASDDDGTIENVEFFNGNTCFSVIKSAPWEATWNNISQGSYTIKAVATDNSGLKTESNIVYITVSDSPPTLNQPPVIYISSVEPESLYAPTNITITAEASDPDGSVSSVEFFNGSKSLGIKSAPPWIMEWGDVPAGTYYLSATATDNLGSKTKSSAYSLTINELPNHPPVVSIINPVDRQVFENNDEIQITIAASDPDGSIERIELYDGSEMFAEISSSPWTYSWKYAGEGVHNLSAVAIDNLNESTVSAPVSIEVKAGQNNEPEENEHLLDLYPNPNNGHFTIALLTPEQEEVCSLNIISGEGKTMHQEMISGEDLTKEMDLSFLNSGFYVLIITVKGQIKATKKFIIL